MTAKHRPLSERAVKAPVVSSNSTRICLQRAADDASPVSGYTHDFYRYPARFSPKLAKAIIETFSVPGDLVFDPFAGGGTTLVEAMALGRQAFGTCG